MAGQDKNLGIVKIERIENSYSEFENGQSAAKFLII